MATLNDDYNQLVEANSQLTNLHNDLQQVDAPVQACTAATQAGFSNLDQLARYTNQLLTYEIEHKQTINFYLAKIAKQTCELVNQATLQAAAQQAMEEDLDELEALTELANPAAAVE